MRSLNKIINDSIIENWNRPALTNVSVTGNFTFADTAGKIAQLHAFYSQTGIGKGDKIAICARNSAQWAIAFLSIVSYGAVAVPLLNEFTPDDITNLLRHSNSRILFTDAEIWEHLHDNDNMPQEIEAVIDTADEFSILGSNRSARHAWESAGENVRKLYPAGLSAADIKYIDDNPSQLALINYTSGSTGNPKGVMIPRRALVSNLQFAFDLMPYLKAGDGIVSILPMAHMYGLLVEVLFPFAVGAHTRFLGKIPSPTVLLQAFADTHPKLVITVPLVIDKIIKTRVFPRLRTTKMKILWHTPVIGAVMRSKIRRQLLDVFGGNLHEMIIGGASLDPVVEKFLTSIRFPFTIGYGMTECAPLIAYAPWNNRRLGSCGRLVDRMEARIESPDPHVKPGELLLRGDNVMLGYYNNPEATTQTIDQDGWMRTGDMVTCDKDGLFYIRGRNKTMILGPSGQNIYPEEIEAMLQRLPYVEECLVVSRDNKLVALVYPDEKKMKDDGIDNGAIIKIMDDNIKALNAKLQVYSRISSIELRKEPFKKTPKHSIKRFLYS
ncbi:MAG: AMP-binding protein [Muribaculaceae bacterium]|jgi:Long-chain acyl-CoA synthetases (AMP-forming)|nr:AMP-binding protein [Muribaculaceae bacterium]